MASLKRCRHCHLCLSAFRHAPGDARSGERTLEYVAAHREDIDFLNLAIFNLPINCPEADNSTRTGSTKETFRSTRISSILRGGIDGR